MRLPVRLVGLGEAGKDGHDLVGRRLVEGAAQIPVGPDRKSVG